MQSNTDAVLQKAKEVILQELEPLLVCEEKAALDARKLQKQPQQTLEEKRLQLIREMKAATVNATHLEQLEITLIDYLCKNANATKDKIKKSLGRQAKSKDIQEELKKQGFGKFHQTMAKNFPNLLLIVAEETSISIELLATQEARQALMEQLQFRQKRVQDTLLKNSKIKNELTQQEQLLANDGQIVLAEKEKNPATALFDMLYQIDEIEEKIQTAYSKV